MRSISYCQGFDRIYSVGAETTNAHTKPDIRRMCKGGIGRADVHVPVTWRVYSYSDAMHTYQKALAIQSQSH